jgi:hypothetical protein
MKKAATTPSLMIMARLVILEICAKDIYDSRYHKLLKIIDEVTLSFFAPGRLRRGGRSPSPIFCLGEFLIRLELDLLIFDHFVTQSCSAWTDDNCELRTDEYINGAIEFRQFTYWERLWITQEVAWAREPQISDGFRSVEIMTRHS